MLRLSSPILEIRDFRHLFLTRSITAMALQVQAVIVGWQVYQLRPDALLLGLIGLAEAIPAISCAFISGHIVDTHRPALIYRLSLLTLFFNTLLIWTAVWPELDLTNDQRLVLLFSGVFLSGAARSFTSPSVFTLIPQLVPRSMLSAASAWNSSAFQFASIVGPALGGVIYSQFGARLAFAVPPLLLLIGLGGAQTLSAEAKSLKSPHAHEPYLKSLQAAIKFALGQRVLLSSMVLDMFSVLFGGALALLPIFAEEIYRTGSTGLGLLRAAPAVGSVLVALTLALRPMKVISGRMLLWAVAGFGLTMILFALSTHFVFALVFLALSGAFDGVSMVIRATILQLLTPDHMRGRVSALSSIFITSSNEIGAFESGVAARLLGLVPSVVFGGTMTLFIVAATAWKVPELRSTRLTHDES